MMLLFGGKSNLFRWSPWLWYCGAIFCEAPGIYGMGGAPRGHGHGFTASSGRQTAGNSRASGHSVRLQPAEEPEVNGFCYLPAVTYEKASGASTSQPLFMYTATLTVEVFSLNRDGVEPSPLLLRPLIGILYQTCKI
jgi:hypothetical protein